MVKDTPKCPPAFVRPRSHCIPPWRPDPGHEAACTNSKVRVPGFYLVRRGHELGVFTSWATTEPKIWKYDKPSHQRFDTYNEALQNWQEKCASGVLDPHDCDDDDIEVVGSPPRESIFNADLRSGRRSRLFIASSLKAINVAAASVDFDHD
ncbi:hypothetical protein BDZ89DRAFT_1136634 [Hymenopellis radicata]|nr:hypothetical protein BDZ89DRAFT_1136634 [Hymenopellis radicata]